MIHVLDLTAAGCQYRGIGIEAGMAAERGARDNRPHDQLVAGDIFPFFVQIQSDGNTAVLH